MTTLKPSVGTINSNKDEITTFKPSEAFQQQITTFNPNRDIKVTTEPIQSINNQGKFALE